MRTTIVSSCDEKYYPFLKGLIASVREHRPAGDRTEISVVDAGFNDAQRDELRRDGIKFQSGRWDFDFPKKSQTPSWYQAMTCRAWARDYFPGYDVYIWIDSDAWLQDWRAIDLLQRGAQQAGGFAIVPEVHNAYGYLWRQGELADFTIECYRRSFGEEAASAMAYRPIVNNGVWSMTADCPFWKHYADWVIEGFRGEFTKWTEQGGFNLALADSGLPFVTLPAWCNWVCHYALPVYDRQRRNLCEPTLPFEPLSICHVTGANNPGLILRSTDGGAIEMPIDYLGFRAAIARG